MISGFLGLSDKDVTVAAVVEHNLVDYVVVFENALFVRELGDIVRSLWVVGSQFLVDNFVLLFLCEILLIGLLVGLHIEQFVVVLEIFGDFFLLDLLLAFLAGFLDFWWHSNLNYY